MAHKLQRAPVQCELQSHSPGAVQVPWSQPSLQIAGRMRQYGWRNTSQQTRCTIISRPSLCAHITQVTAPMTIACACIWSCARAMDACTVADSCINYVPQYNSRMSHTDITARAGPSSIACTNIASLADAVLAALRANSCRRISIGANRNKPSSRCDASSQQCQGRAQLPRRCSQRDNHYEEHRRQVCMRM
jgi:hypothetical protein